MDDFKLKITGKVNKWNALNNTFEVWAPIGEIKIETNSQQLRDELIEAMKDRTNVSLTVGEAKE